MADDASSKPTHLEPSELGTKEYWDNLYTNELTNHSHNPSDKGTVWFDDSDAETKLLEFLEDQTDPDTTTLTTPPPTTSISSQQGPETVLQKESTSFLDLGCGNGSLLFALRDEGWQGRCLGVDYSEKSVALARQIAASEDQAGNERVEFEVWDVLQGPYDTVLTAAAAAAAAAGGTGEQEQEAHTQSQDQTRGWDVVHDKGTFDAISLSEERDAAGRRICEGYKGRIVRLVRPGGLFLVTSCNWTEEELEGWFGEASAAVEGGRFVRVGRVNYPSFSFGGVKGQTISTVCYQKL